MVGDLNKELDDLVVGYDVKEFLRDLAEGKLGEVKKVVVMWVDEKDDNRCGYVFPGGLRERLGLISICRDIIAELSMAGIEEEDSE